MKGEIRQLSLILLILVVLSGASIAYAPVSLPLLYVDPADNVAEPGESFTLNITIQDVTDLYSYEFKLGFDSGILAVTSVDQGPFLTGPLGTLFYPLVEADYVHVAHLILGGYPGVSGSGVLCSITFDVIDAGACALDLYETIMLNSTVGELPHDTAGGYFSTPAPPQHTLTISVVGSGTTAPPPDTYLFDAGTEVDVTASPEAGWTLDHWELDGVDVGADDPYTVTMDMDHTLTAVSVEVTPTPIDPTTFEVPEDYPRIQQAIDAANPGDIIHVASGTYFEKLKISKSLKLIGEGASKTVIVETGTVVLIEASDVELRGFSVRNGTYGVFLWYCSGVLLRDNEISNNTWNFAVTGNSISHFVHDIDSSNTVDGKPMYYWVNKHGEQVPEDAGYVALINSTNILVRNADLTPNEQGILLISTKNSIIENVTIAGNDEGISLRLSHNNTVRKSRLFSMRWRAIYLEYSYNNTFYENTLLGSTYGLSIKASTNNMFYHNNFIDNNDQVYREISENRWHSESHEGNYWSNYPGNDADGDSIGDTHLPWEGVDWHPLMRVYDEEPPKARAGTDRTVPRNTPVSFDAAYSSDNVYISEYLWDFGDGSNGAGPNVTHNYGETGIFTVRLTVIDLAGKSAEDTLEITVVGSPLPPFWWILTAGFLAGAAILTIIGFWRYKQSRRQTIDG
jgi:parallel beta-helix repeat protein